MLWLPGLDEKPFSVLGDRPLAFAVAAVGPFSRALQRLRPGDRIWARGPLGHGFEIRGQRHLLAGGGYGAAPLLFLARRMAEDCQRLDVVLGAGRAEDLLFGRAFEAAGAALHVVTEDGSSGERGLATEAVEALLDGRRYDCLYACGPRGMLVALEVLCRDRRLCAQLAWEAHMRCALGLCGSCEHEGRLLCREGPVLIHEAPPER
jgi:dihydroorotate dehydrogenase electron transfer subunit